jgi:hypothetical protein
MLYAGIDYHKRYSQVHAVNTPRPKTKKKGASFLVLDGDTTARVTARELRVTGSAQQLRVLPGGVEVVGRLIELVLAVVCHGRCSRQ